MRQIHKCCEMWCVVEGLLSKLLGFGGGWFKIGWTARTQTYRHGAQSSHSAIVITSFAMNPRRREMRRELPIYFAVGMAISAAVWCASLSSSLQHSYIRPYLPVLSPSSDTRSQGPEELPHWSLALEGPWFTEGATSPNWTRSPTCNPYSGRCACLREWGVFVCPEAAQAGKAVHLYVAPGWMRDWPYLPGLHRCRRSLCNVTHSVGSSPAAHAKLHAIVNAQNENAGADGSVLVGLAMESKVNYPLHITGSFANFFHLGVSYAHGHLDLQTTYNNYYPGQFRSRGAPFAKKRDALLWLAGNCVQQRLNLVQKLSRHINVESFGSCFHNAGEHELSSP